MNKRRYAGAFVLQFVHWTARLFEMRKIDSLELVQPGFSSPRRSYPWYDISGFQIQVWEILCLPPTDGFSDY
jgi:hypothetical protein